MTDTARDKVAHLEREVQGELLDALQSGAAIESLKDCRDKLVILGDIKVTLNKRGSPTWLLPASVAILGASLVGLGSLIRLEQVELRLDAKLHALTVEALDGEFGLRNAKTVAVSKFNIVDPDAPDFNEVTAFSALEILPGTRAQLSLDPDGCTTIQVDRSRMPDAPDVRPALRVNVHRTNSDGTVARTPIAISPGGAIAFCTAALDDYLLLGRVAALDLTRIHLRDNQTNTIIRASSIKSGSYSMPAVNSTVTLSGLDRIKADRISNGWAVIGRTDALTLTFSGTVGRFESLDMLTSYGPGQQKPEALTPTLLDWVSRSPWLTSLFGLFTGIVGIIWSAVRYFR